MRGIVRLLGFIFATGAIVFVVAAAVLAAVVWKYEQDLPDYSQLKNYEPPVMTRVHAADGSLLAEYSRERRLYLPSSAIPDLVKQAFISAEDKNFYSHGGFDPEGIVRAGFVFLQGSRHVQGASTITQQVAKNFLLNSDRTFDRKIREILLSVRIESAYSKEKILELYLNEIYLGLSNYGVAAAALNYFNKSVHELSIAEVAYLAALPKEPSALNPFRNHDRAIERRNYVIGRMAEDGYITADQARQARAEPLNVNPRVLTPNTIAAGFFAEEVRRELCERYGEQKLYEGGLSVRTTLDPKVQLMARKALVDGLVRYDEAHGWHGALKSIDLGQDWGVPLADIPAYGDIKPWQLAVALDVSPTAIRIGLQPDHDKAGAVVQDRQTGTVSPDGYRWTGRGAKSLVKPGDVFYVEPVAGKAGEYRLRQIPEVSGACVAMDPFTGRVLAMVGGFSFDESEFNRATQAQRQPGSSFKPFVYAAALDKGYTPSSQILDAPVQIDDGSGEMWQPANFEGKSGGTHTLRFGVEHSINLMTVRLARDLGMPLVVEYAKRFGVYDNLPPFLSMSHRRGRDDGAAHGDRLFDVRQRRQADQGDADRPHPGPLGQHDLQARRTHLRGLRRGEMGKPARADADRQARAGDRPAQRLPDHLDHGGRDPARHRHRDQGGRQDAGRQDRHHQRRQGPLVRRLFPEPGLRRVHGLRQAALARRQRAGGALHRADLPRLHEDGAEGHARHAVPHSAGDQADFGRRPFRHALERAGLDPRGVQARHRPARQLRLGRRRRRRPGRGR